MARHTSFGVGGPADYWVEVRRLGALRLALTAADELGLTRTVMGHGTNTLVADAGIDGLVIYDRCMGFKHSETTQHVRVESGHSMARLAGRCARLGIKGLTFAIGVPGSVGGAIYGNAGAFGSDVAAVLASALIWRTSGEHETPATELDFGYRRSSLLKASDHPVVLEATFRVETGSASDLRHDLLRLARKRRASQPQGRHAGSFFKNPPNDFAGRLIEAAGLKGRRHGTAFVSPVHANFLSSDDGGRARDVLNLAIDVQHQVAESSGIVLVPEVRFVGRWDEPTEELFT
jgi:UDP-N-acetylmuramate dehydrogenase